jgi:hypothetical protein
MAALNPISSEIPALALLSRPYLRLESCVFRFQLPGATAVWNVRDNIPMASKADFTMTQSKSKASGAKTAR